MAPPVVYTRVFPVEDTPVSKKRAPLDDPSAATAAAEPEERQAKKRHRLDDPSVATATATALAEPEERQPQPAVKKRPRVDQHPVTVPRCILERHFVLSTKIGQGSYGVVFKAFDRRDCQTVALKRLVDPSWRVEVECLDACRHPNVVRLKDVATDAEGRAVFLVMDFACTNLWKVLQSRPGPFSEGEAKYLMLQLLRAVKCIHDHGILHRDLKTANILVDHSGDLKICDFGLSCKQQGTCTPNTATVVTLWYRAPELLLGAKEYSSAIDMWSLGCIMAEMLNKQALFQGTTVDDQIRRIFGILGTPDLKVWPGLSAIPGALGVVHRTKRQWDDLRGIFPATPQRGRPILSRDGYHFLKGLLNYDPEKRLTAEAALEHAWFRENPPAIKPKGLHQDQARLDQMKLERLRQHKQCNPQINPVRPSHGHAVAR